MASTMLAFHGLAISGVALSSPVSTRIQYNSKSNGLQGSFLGQTLALRKDRLSIYPGNDRSHLVVYANAESTSGGGFLSSFMDYFRNLTSPKPAPSSNGATYAEEQRQDRRAVLVVGSTGRTGRHVVAKLLAKGHDVLALVGSLDRFKEVLVKEMGLKEGKNGGAKLTPVVGDALSGPEVLAPIVDQSDAIICALGSRTQAPSSREPSLLKATYTSGVINFIKAAQSTIKKRPGRKIREEVKLFDFSSSQVAPAEEGADVAVPGWKSMNDVMVGGTSTSTMVLQDESFPRRNLLAAGGALLASKVLLQQEPALAAAAGAIPKGFQVRQDAVDGYQFLYPFGWQEVIVRGQDVVFKDVIEPLESVSVTVLGTERADVSELGPPEEVAQTLLSGVLAGPSQKTKLLEAKERKTDGYTYYMIEFTSEASNYKRHALSAVAVNKGKFYTLTTGANERRWGKVSDKLKIIVDSFSVATF